MAGNKMNTKTKGREDRNKANNKTIGQTNEDAEDPDFALLRKPIHTSITGFAQARKIFDLATEELKDLLSNECDLLYECKVCRNIFRSLANFISHKRVYCKEKFNISVHSHFVKTTSAFTELMKIKHVEQGYQESLKESDEQEKDQCNTEDRIPITKDLTTIIEKITKNRGSYESNNEETQIALQKIPNSTVAVYQNVELNKEKESDEMGAQVKELDNILSKDVAVLQSDGKFKIKSSASTEADSVIQISDDEDNDHRNILKCKICDMQFSTQKTLKFHMKYKHVESRLVYPCPDCLEIFSTSWSVYRHLFKVHRKTAAQIRRLRESIQAKAFKMNNPPAFYEKRKNNMKAATTTTHKITEEERLEQENQAWMDNMEGDGELPRCGGCGRTFERRAALAAHTHTCQPRSRALARRPQETKKIEIQIRKDYNKGPSINLNLPLKTEPNEKPKEEPPSANKPEKEEPKTELEEEKDIEEDVPMETNGSEDEKSNESIDSPETEIIRPQIEIPKLNVRLPFAHQTEKNNLVTFRQKIQSAIELNKLMCKRCDVKFNEIQKLYDHMADHIKWMRYGCKLCNFKSYSFSELPEHVKVVHKLKGDKDFYYSTVKAIDGAEALDLCEPLESIVDTIETSPESRRPSRCSSDSSRLSDDSSSSSTRLEGSRKRKSYQNKNSAKRRKEVIMKGGDETKDDIVLEKSTSLPESLTSSLKSFEENSSDMDDIAENITKKQITIQNTSVASRRPVRRKTKPKNEDFEYDLSNLLKMEAQGYRDALVMQANAKTTHSKKKIQQEIQITYDNMNKDCCGALMVMSKKCVEKASAHIRTDPSSFQSIKEIRPQNPFLRPMLPKTLSRGEKVSPKKDTNEDRKETISPIKDPKLNKVLINVPVKAIDQPVNNDQQPNEDSLKISDVTKCSVKDNQSENKEPCKSTDVVRQSIAETPDETPAIKEPSLSKPTIELKKPISIPPIKFRRQSLDVMKNPLINKNISDFTKAGMKTKILVIKPINRNKDGTQTVKTPLKFQTIKLKDHKNISNEDKVSDQVVVVKVPKVERAIARAVTEVPVNSDKQSSVDTPQIVLPSYSDSSHTKPVLESTNTDNKLEHTESKKEVSNDNRLKSNDENTTKDSNKNDDVEMTIENDSLADKSIQSVNDNTNT